MFIYSLILLNKLNEKMTRIWLLNAIRVSDEGILKWQAQTSRSFSPITKYSLNLNHKSYVLELRVVNCYYHSNL